MIHKPMSAAGVNLGDPKELSIFKGLFPLCIEIKIDGIRMTVQNGVGLSRSGKPIRNAFVQARIQANPEFYEGLDGELTIGPLTDPLCYNKTSSAVMSVGGSEEVMFNIFDKIPLTEEDRAMELGQRKLHLKTMTIPDIEAPFVSVVPWFTAITYESMLEFEEQCLTEGHEGVVGRTFDGTYKNGRSTLRQGFLIKIKRFVDTEGIIFDKTEKMHNANPATLSELGYTVRSSDAGGLIPTGTLGAFWVRGVWRNNEVFECKVGSGFTDEMRQLFWDRKQTGKTIKFKYFPVGCKDAPRHGIFLGFRDPEDMEKPLDPLLAEEQLEMFGD